MALAVLLMSACSPSGTATPASAPTTAPPPAAAKPAGASPAIPASPAVAGSPAVAASPAASPAAAASPIAAASPAASAATPTNRVSIKVAYPQVSASITAVFVAQDQGYFSQNGLDVSLSQVAGPAEVAALGANEIQFGIIGVNEVANADVGGGDLVGVATTSDLPLFSLYAASKYHTVEDLDGQSVGVTALGTASEAVARFFLKHFNMQDKVKVIAAGGSQPSILAAMEQGIVAAGVLAAPTTVRAAEAGMNELVNGVKLGIPLNNNLITVKRSYLSSQQDVVRRFLSAYQQAWTFSANPANQSAVTAILAKYTKTSVDDAKAGYDYVFPVYSSKKTPTVDMTGVKNVLDLSPIPQVQSTDPTKLVDNTLMEQVGAQAGG